MSLLQIDQPTEGYYLPHYGVVSRPDDSSKLRVVFNGSRRTTNNLAINDTLLVGPALHNNISTVLMRSRRHKYMFSANI